MMSENDLHVHGSTLLLQYNFSSLTSHYENKRDYEHFMVSQNYLQFHVCTLLFQHNSSLSLYTTMRKKLRTLDNSSESLSCAWYVVFSTRLFSGSHTTTLREIMNTSRYLRITYVHVCGCILIRFNTNFL